MLREYYRQMALIRAFELRAAEMYTRARIGGYCHLNLGEEATVVGLTAALRDEDYLFATYREHGYALARGADPGRVMAELFGREDGLSRGRGGSMHLFDPRTPPAGRVRDRRRPDPAGDRRRVRDRLQDRPGTGRARRDVPAGRCHHQHRRVPRVAEPGRAVAPAGRVRDRQQPARHGHPGRGGLRRAGTVEARLRLPDARAAGGRQRRPGRPRRRPRGPGESPRRAPADAAGDGQLPAARPLGGRPRPVPHRRRHRAAAPRRPAARLPLPPHGAGILDEETAAQIDAEADKAVAAAVDFADASPAPDVTTLFDHVYATPAASVYRGLPGDPVTGGGPA